MISNSTSSDGDRFAACWRYQECGDCIYSPHGCGWCAVSQSCVPAKNLLEPISNAAICPLWSERWELRTGALGCACSTTTLLSVVITVIATIVGLAVLCGLGLAVSRINPFLGTGQVTGTELEMKGDGTRHEKQWVRDTWPKWLYRQFARPDLNKHSEQEEITERSRLLG
ncbi:hypothetical protein MYCFIDRAFT_175736 [Lecanosticta acicola]|uniref:PSI domain-containing protein n=1 Tax=Lecanosticta acicola TaxID=111012 RepID=A0AAI8YVW7_9PEZI|nr:hypothetical protein MYCFIDRAFT_175736 [Lecanosticta acicola]